MERMQREVRRLAPGDMEVVVREVENPVEYAWRGGASLAKDSEFEGMCVSKQEYMESGFQACQQKFYL
jgi:actin-related protein 6